MKNEAGVKSLAFGGRPLYGPMKAMGGIKGGQSTAANELISFVRAAQIVAKRTAEGSNAVHTQEQLEKPNATAPTADLPLNESALNLNFHNATGREKISFHCNVSTSLLIAVCSTWRKISFIRELPGSPLHPLLGQCEEPQQSPSTNYTPTLRWPQTYQNYCWFFALSLSSFILNPDQPLGEARYQCLLI